DGHGGGGRADGVGWRRDGGGADRGRGRVGGCGGGRNRGGGRGRGGARRTCLHRTRQSLRRHRRCAGGGQGCDRPTQSGRRVDHVRDAAGLQTGRRGRDDRHGQDHSVRGRG